MLDAGISYGLGKGSVRMWQDTGLSSGTRPPAPTSTGQGGALCSAARPSTAGLLGAAVIEPQPPGVVCVVGLGQKEGAGPLLMGAAQWWGPERSKHSQATHPVSERSLVCATSSWPGSGLFRPTQRHCGGSWGFNKPPWRMAARLWAHGASEQAG